MSSSQHPELQGCLGPFELLYSWATSLPDLEAGFQIKVSAGSVTSWFLVTSPHFVLTEKVGQANSIGSLLMGARLSAPHLLSKAPVPHTITNGLWRGDIHPDLWQKAFSHLPQLPGSGKKERVSLHGDLAGISWSRPNTLNYECRGHLGALRLGEFWNRFICWCLLSFCKC